MSEIWDERDMWCGLCGIAMRSNHAFCTEHGLGSTETPTHMRMRAVMGTHYAINDLWDLCTALRNYAQVSSSVHTSTSVFSLQNTQDENNAVIDMLSTQAEVLVSEKEREVSCSFRLFECV
jgi:hypothetical protein